MPVKPQALRDCAAQLRAANKTYEGCFEFIQGKLKILRESFRGVHSVEFEQSVRQSSELLRQYREEAETAAKQLDRDAELLDQFIRNAPRQP